MKTIAFAGQYNTLTQIARKYTGRNYLLDIMHRRMSNDEQVQILISKDPYGQENNRFQWTHMADKIFVCVDAENANFARDFEDEVKMVHDLSEKIVLIGYTAGFDQDKYLQFKEFSSNYNYPLIYCFTDANDAYYLIEGKESHRDFSAIMDKVINNKMENELMAEVIEPVQDRKRRRCSIM